MNHLKVARLALQMYQASKTDRVYAFNLAYNHLLEAQTSNEASKHLWLCAAIADLAEVVNAGVTDMRVAVLPCIEDITTILNDLD